MKHPILTVFAAVLLLSACGRDGPFTPTEEWAADLGETKPAFTFTGRYAGCCIQGILHGSEFDSVGVGFERP
jgi:hypothetical protein